MDEKIPHSKTEIADSDIKVGGNFQQATSIYNNTYIQGQTVIVPSRLTNRVPSDASHILGREVELAETFKQLHAGNPTVLVNGVGGIGKTAVATKYSVQHAEYYKHRAWLTINSSLKDAFINDGELLRALHIESAVQDLIKAQQSDAAFNLVFKSINDLNDCGRTLIVLDNANEAAELVNYQKLFKTAHAHFLITSRTKPEQWKIVQIKPLDEAVAVDLFRKYYPSVSTASWGSEVTTEDIKSLLNTLFYHTLLIELVAKSAEASAIPFKDLSHRLQTAFYHDKDLNKRRIDMGEHGDSLENNFKRAKVEEYIWFIFETMTDLSEDLQNILRAFVLLPLAESFDEDFLAQHVQIWQLEKDIYDNLDLLNIGGWLEKEQEAGQKATFKMHPLIADVVVKHLGLDVDFSEVYVEKIITLINYSNHNPEHNLFEKSKMKLFAERLSDLFFNVDSEVICYLLDRISNLEQNFGLYHKAFEYSDRVLKIAEAIFENNHESIAEYQNNLANVYSYLGNHIKAKELLEIALLNDLKIFGTEHHTIIIRQSNLAVVYQNLSYYSDAANLLETALKTALKIFDSESFNVATCQANLANVYNDLEEYEQAKALLEAALKSGLKHFGSEHPVIAIRQSNLGDIYRKLGNYEKAKEMLEAALIFNIKN